MKNKKESVVFNAQDPFLYDLRKMGKPIEVQLINGHVIRGRLTRYDRFTIMVDTELGEQMIYKHAIAVVAPQKEGL